MLAGSADLQQQLAAREDARAEERIQNALRVAGDLIDETIAGLRGLVSAGSGGRPDSELASGTEALGQINWEWLSGLTEGNPLAQQAVGNLQTLASQHDCAAPSVNEVCAILMVVRSEIDGLIDAQPRSLSIAWATQVLQITAQIVAAVAVGLIAAAASAASAGTGIVSALLPAAVGVVATGLCGRLVEAARAALQPPTSNACMQAAHKKLADMLADLTVFVRRMGETSPGLGRDRALVRDTAFSARVMAMYAGALAQTLDWSGASDYIRELEHLRKVCDGVARAAAQGDAASRALAERLDSAVQGLSNRVIPDDLRPLGSTVSNLPPLAQPGPHTPAEQPHPVTPGLETRRLLSEPRGILLSTFDEPNDGELEINSIEGPEPPSTLGPAVGL